MLLRDDGHLLDRLLTKRERGVLGTRCAESQADGVPCPDPDCDCDHCARAFVATPADRVPNGKTPHA